MRRSPIGWPAVLLGLVLALAGFLSVAVAQNCVEEVEPNDTPGNAVGLGSTRCFVGDLSGNDQDAWVWDVTEDDGGVPWTMTVEGIRGQLTKVDILRIAFADDGVGVASADTLFVHGTSDGSPATTTPFLVTPGERLFLGVSKSGGEGQYVVSLEQGRSLSRGRDRLDRADSTGAFGIAGTLEGELEVSWTITEEDAVRRWGLVLMSAIDTTVDGALIGPDGRELGSLRAPSGAVRLDSLGLEPGIHTVRLQTRAGERATFVLDAEPQGILTDGNEIEPNNRYEDANLLPFASPLVGGGGDQDWYVIDVDEEAANGTWDLSIDADRDVSVQLLDGNRDLLQRRSGIRGTLPGLKLAEGQYWLVVDAGESVRYTLELTVSPPAGEGFELEPNDELRGASRVPENLGVRGNLGPQDVDVFRFTTEGEPQLFRFQVIGDSAGELTVYNGGGIRVQSVRGDGRIRLDNVVLLPGTHYVAVGRGTGDYALRALPLGPAAEPSSAKATDPDAELARAPTAPSAEATAEADPEAIGESGPPPPSGRVELEPNDDESRAELLVPGAVQVGRLPEGDTDTYRFFMPNDGRVQIELQNAEAGVSVLDLSRDGDGRIVAREGDAIDLDVTLLAGDYFVTLDPTEATDGFYQLRLRHLDPFAAPADTEPNDVIAMASHLPSSGVVTGELGGRDRFDWIRLPVSTDPMGTRVVLTGENTLARLYRSDTETRIDPVAETTTEEGVEIQFELAAGLPTAIRIQGDGTYRLEVVFEVPPESATLRPEPGGPARLEPVTPSLPVAAYWHTGQVVETSLSLTHTGDMDTTYRLVAHVGDLDARVTVPETIAAAAGETVTIPVTIELLADLRDDAPIRVTVGAIDRAGFRTIDTGGIELTPECSADPVAPQRVWPMPELLLGTFDVAYAGFGASVAEENREDLIDGRSSPSSGETMDIGEALTVRLAWGGSQTLVGVILDPQSNRGPGGQLAAFRIETSLDGERFDVAFEGDLRASKREQAFEFAEPVEAMFVRLVALSAQAGGTRAGIGELKLLAADPHLTELNLLDPSLGGHLAWSNVRPSFFEGTLATGGSGASIGARRPPELVWVYGFHHGRAARIERLVWTPNAGEGHRIERVEVATSTTGPAGPFEVHTTWDVKAGPLELEDPLWARYLRFRVPAPEGDLLSELLIPDAIAAIEASTDDSYRSILGEWGGYGREAVFELLEGDGAVGDVSVPPDAGDDRAAATLLASGSMAQGSVSVGEDVDWYRIDMPEGDNLIELVLEGSPVIDYRYALYDEHGEELYFDTRQEGDRVRLSAHVETASVYLELSEPKRSVIFAWDTSASVGPYQAITYNSLARFARDVDPDREFVQLLAYDSPTPRWVLPYWSADPARVQTAINEFDRRADSSDSFAAMTVATEALADREGTRAILLMTDAETGGFDFTPRLWEALGEVRPRVFTFEISTRGSDWTQDLMQTWAAVNDGHYGYARNVGDFDVGFRRAACKLRRPKAYGVEVGTSFSPPPGPGSLSVLPAAGAARPAVEVILDASGSMGALLPSGTPRIDEARNTLRELVEDGLPEGTPFALRAFGHVSPSSCEQELVIPLGPLQRASAGAAIAGIEPKLLSQTPIADALRAAASDLTDAGARAAVVLITDGEESCGGNPEAAVAELRAAGVDVTLSIVSLGLDDAAASERFASLAAIGGGSYLDVENGSELGAAVTASLATPFDVLGPDGTKVASGTVGGEPVELPQGVYTILVPGNPPITIRDVRVPGDGSVTVAAER